MRATSGPDEDIRGGEGQIATPEAEIPGTDVLKLLRMAQDCARKGEWGEAAVQLRSLGEDGIADEIAEDGDPALALEMLEHAALSVDLDTFLLRAGERRSGRSVCVGLRIRDYCQLHHGICRHLQGSH